MDLAGSVRVPAHVICRDLEAETVFLNLETETYLGLDGTGTRMWSALASTPSIQSAFEQLLEEFDVEPERLRTDLEALVRRLLENGLLIRA